MRSKAACFGVLVVFCLPLSVFAALPSGSVQREVIQRFEFENPACVNGSCSLRAIRAQVSHYLVQFEDEKRFGTRMDFGYETSTIEQLVDFVVVQKIRGCAFDSRFVSDSQGESRVERSIQTLRRFWGELVKFKHAHWVFDSMDEDPAYNSGADEGKGRHFFYRTNAVKGSFEKNTETLMGEQKTSAPWAYVVDLPSTVAVSLDSQTQRSEAKNLSMQFETCLYESRSVPVSVSDSAAFEEIEGKPIKCMNWMNSWVYDFDQMKYQHPPTVDQFCLK